jgi:hypothetical protein
MQFFGLLRQIGSGGLVKDYPFSRDRLQTGKYRV